MTWFGGKNNPKRLYWILSLLPNNTKTYIEPFGGLASVLLNRPPARVEIYNDLNGRVVNWFKVIRDKPADLIQLLKSTPYAREIYDDCCEALQTPEQYSSVERAYHFTMVVRMSIRHSDNMKGKNKSWLRGMKTDVSKPLAKLPSIIPTISQRFRHVQIENMDACDLIKECNDYRDCLVYCDPPYITRSDEGYTKKEFDPEQLTATLTDHKGQIAISGAQGEWDHLGWECHSQHSSISRSMLKSHKGDMPKSSDIECVWTNYEVPRIPIQS